MQDARWSSAMVSNHNKYAQTQRTHHVGIVFTAQQGQERGQKLRDPKTGQRFLRRHGQGFGQFSKRRQLNIFVIAVGEREARAIAQHANTWE